MSAPASIWMPRVQPTTKPSSYLGLGYDVAGLLKSLDTVTVMGYDQHGTFNPTNPGPVGELSWQRKVLAALLVHAKPSQVDLGVAGYGYRWAADGTHTVGDIRARRLVAAAHVTPTFDEGRGRVDGHPAGRPGVLVGGRPLDRPARATGRLAGPARRRGLVDGAVGSGPGRALSHRPPLRARRVARLAP